MTPRMRAVGFALALLALAACDAGPDRHIVVTSASAARDGRAWHARVRGTYDVIEDVSYPTEAGLSHLVEVEVIDAPAELAGRTLALPYSSWDTKGKPPRPGEIVRFSPQEWVGRAGRAPGRAPRMPAAP